MSFRMHEYSLFNYALSRNNNNKKEKSFAHTIKTYFFESEKKADGNSEEKNTKKWSFFLFFFPIPILSVPAELLLCHEESGENVGRSHRCWGFKQKSNFVGRFFFFIWKNDFLHWVKPKSFFVFHQKNDFLISQVFPGWQQWILQGIFINFMKLKIKFLWIISPLDFPLHFPEITL